MKLLIDDAALRERVERALRAADDLQRQGALPPVLSDLLLLLDDAGSAAAKSPCPLPATSLATAIIRTLASAEDRLEFVALSFLRETLVPEATGVSGSTAAEAIHAAIRDGLVLTDRIENPRNLKRPTTTVRLNRAHPTVQALAPEVAVSQQFDPIVLRGPALSSTVMEDRR